MTVRDLINGALRLLGVLAAGESPSDQEAADAVDSLNAMIDEWKNQRMLVYTMLSHNLPFVANKRSYTLGPGGDLDIPRPSWIADVRMVYTATGNSLPIILPITMITLEEYNAIYQPGTPSPIPEWVYINDDNPLRTATFWTVPDTGYSANIYTSAAVEEFTGTIAEILSTELVLPPGYRKALRYNLAVELANEYGKSVSAETAAGAVSSLANIKIKNSPLLYAQADPAVQTTAGLYNIITDSFGRTR